MFLPRSHCVPSKFLFWDDSETRTTASILQVNTVQRHDGNGKARLLD